MYIYIYIRITHFNKKFFVTRHISLGVHEIYYTIYSRNITSGNIFIIIDFNLCVPEKEN